MALWSIANLLLIQFELIEYDCMSWLSSFGLDKTWTLSHHYLESYGKMSSSDCALFRRRRSKWTMSATDVLRLYVILMSLWFLDLISLLTLLKCCMLFDFKFQWVISSSFPLSISYSHLKRPKIRPGPARVASMDGGALEVSMTVDGRRQLRDDWPLLLHHACVSRWQVVCT